MNGGGMHALKTAAISMTETVKYWNYKRQFYAPVMDEPVCILFACWIDINPAAYYCNEHPFVRQIW